MCPHYIMQHLHYPTPHPPRSLTPCEKEHWDEYGEVTCGVKYSNVVQDNILCVGLFEVYKKVVHQMVHLLDLSVFV